MYAIRSYYDLPVEVAPGRLSVQADDRFSVARALVDVVHPEGPGAPAGGHFVEARAEGPSYNFV